MDFLYVYIIEPSSGTTGNDMIDEDKKETRNSNDWVSSLINLKMTEHTGRVLKKNRKESALKTAASLLEDGFPPEKVEKYTGLSHTELMESGLLK